MGFLSHFSRIGDINYIIKNIITDYSFNNLNAYFNGHAIFFDLLFLYYC